jgi:hypothetical protein
MIEFRLLSIPGSREVRNSLISAWAGDDATSLISGRETSAESGYRQEYQVVHRMIVADPPPLLRQGAQSDTWRIRIQGSGSRIPPTAAGLCSGAKSVRSDFSKGSLVG